MTPKQVASQCVKALQRIKPKPRSITVRKASTGRTRGWDQSYYVILDIVLSDGADVAAGITLHVANDGNGREASGIVQLDAKYGGVISIARAKTSEEVIRRMMSDTVTHLSR